MRCIKAAGWGAKVYPTNGITFSTHRWELFDTSTDFDAQHNLGEKYPGKHTNMVRLF